MKVEWVLKTHLFAYESPQGMSNEDDWASLLQIGEHRSN